MTPTNATTKTVAFRLPDLGEGVVDTEIIRWLVAEGDTVVEDQPMVEVMTDKATVEIPSPASGKVLTLHAAAGTTVAVGSVIVEIAGDGTSTVSNSRPVNAPGVGGAAAPVSARVAAAAERAQQRHGGPAASAPGAPLELDGASGGRSRPGRVQATPLVRKRAAELGVDLTQVTGTGPNGRITEGDLATASASASATGTTPSADPTTPFRASAPVRVGVRKTELLTGMRRAIADRLTQAQQVPTVTVVEECELTAVEAARREAGVGFLPYVIRAVVRGFAEVPEMNAHLDEVEREIVQYERIDTGIAVQTAAGLVVPVLRDVTAGSLAELEARVGVLADGAKNNTLTPA
ncbi:MAG: 2-oxo acid dehydrogenase subunit E2, partial [Thermoleophilia bacterium]|nr:2-oxo acid dehydrogenase subunit E2 [Thermoleophilia bacterium]